MVRGKHKCDFVIERLDWNKFCIEREVTELFKQLRNALMFLFTKSLCLNCFIKQSFRAKTDF